jgi:hypothetical protein
MPAELRCWAVDAPIAFRLRAPDLVLTELVNAGWNSHRIGARQHRAIQRHRPAGRRALFRTDSRLRTPREGPSFVLTTRSLAHDCLSIELASGTMQPS